MMEPEQIARLKVPREWEGRRTGSKPLAAAT